MAETSLRIEVVYATPERQWLLACEVPAGVSVSEALRLSGVAEQVPGLNLLSSPVGIFGKVVSDPAARLVEEGDRLEVYRPLLADPKEIRRQRAAKAKAARER
ncbi:RnfH family protein [Pseudomonas entomophila]|uniref:RnfH family protein n=1 Tax=Pseudomonas entomophila TaxID=312306 RepID=UPI002010AE40|nr:RnfH family protein [Pseudomonas entomophila]